MFKSFSLGGKRYKVVKERHNTTNLGSALSPVNQIVVQELWEGRQVPEESQEQNAIHEVIHCIFHEIGRSDLSDDEQLVQSIALLMHQFFRTMK